MKDTVPLIALHNIRKSYGSRDAPTVEVLRGISLSIAAGEFVAIVGASGSGKSTLMHILGCLDRPTSGTYRFAGRDVAHCSPDELAWLRREAFGFVFQSYHLLPTASALENVEIPAIYAGVSPAARRARAMALLERLGLRERLEHRPNQLSGGQQQRVSIARALMNGGHIILADEPTGALDSTSGTEVMTLLDALATTGHTVILITHDREVAARAHRMIEMRDGEIMVDSAADACAAPCVAKMAGVPENVDPTSQGKARLKTVSSPARLIEHMATGIAHSTSTLADAREACRAAWRAMWINRFRTMLTLLGIIIGVASVIVMLAVGTGTQQKVLDQMAIFGTNRLYVVPGGDNQRGPGGMLTAADADLVRDVPNVAAAMPYLHGNVTLRYGNVDYQTKGVAITTDFPRILSWHVQHGLFFTKDDERKLATVTVIGQSIQERLFPVGTNPLGQFILVNNVPFQVIGILTSKGALSGDADDDDTIVFPFSTGSRRVYGKMQVSWISVLIDDLGQADTTTQAITELLEAHHRVRDFRVLNKAASIKAQSETQQTMTMLLGLIAAISLLVGGIGVMNIMLMMVRERTREIGIRMATGARQRDILRQFLTEAILVSAIGGVTGVVIGLSIGAALIWWQVPIIFSLTAIIGAFACAVATGLVFGYMPARQAARLDPVVALASE